MTNSRVIPAPHAAVWAALNDPEALKASLPGCESLERVDDSTWKATLAAKVGDVLVVVDGSNVPRPTDNARLKAIALKIIKQIP